MPRDNYETFQNDRPLKVSVCTSALATNVQGFIDELPNKFPDLILEVQFYELPYNDIDRYKFKASDVNIMILCHSIDNRRFAITDVRDALYDEFLSNSAKILGKDRICVIAHDFKSSKGLRKPERYRTEMENFESMQSTTFQHSSLVMMCGKLEGPVELQESNWSDLKEFLMKAARAPFPTPWDFVKKNWKPLACFFFILLLAVGVGLGVLFRSSLPSDSSGSTDVAFLSTDMTNTTTPFQPSPTSTISTDISPVGTSQLPTNILPNATDTPENLTTFD